VQKTNKKTRSKQPKAACFTHNITYNHRQSNFLFLLLPELLVATAILELGDFFANQNINQK
jgi:hypothetical protein